MRGRRRAAHRALVRGSIARLSEATFVVANPQHVAIALEYRPPAVAVPRVLVRALIDDGAQLRQARARALGIPIVEDVQLARTLLATCEIDEPIPRACYLAGRAHRRRFIARGRGAMTPRVASSIFAAVVLAIVAILVVPLPPFLLDALLAFNVLGSGVVLLLSITVGDPLEFAAFAPALLIATLFRLSLDVSATRLILTQGHIAGGVGTLIPAFGELVVGGNLVVGIIVFAILITIQFIVIAAGSQRVAEVAARFTLDAMPGKQMAVDAEVHAGALDAEGARRKRATIQKEADFYGAMDGAGKFVKGDAVAALVIVTFP